MPVPKDRLRSATSKSIPAVKRIHRFQTAASLLLAALIIVCRPVSFATAGQERNPTQATVAHIEWSKQRGATRYRLQIASDEQFSDVLFDGLITGNQYIVSDLPAGHYYWRVSRVGREAGRFIKAVPFEVKQQREAENRATPATISTRGNNPLPNNITSAANTITSRVSGPGWSTATGEIVSLMAVQLRRGAAPDFLGVNSEGTVYALDGSKGIALWTAHFKLGLPGDEPVRSYYNQFAPLVSYSPAPRVIVAFDKGVRALEGSSGREVWNTRIAGSPSSGLVVDAGRSGLPEVYLIGEKQQKLLILDGNTGQIESQVTLRDEALGPPVLITSKDERLLLLPLKGGLVELLKLDGSHVSSIRVGSEITTQPVFVPTSRGQLMMVGTKDGLVAFDAAAFQPLGRIVIDGGDYPLGSLSLADLDGDKIPEVVMTTNNGRVMAVDVTGGKIRWSANVGDHELTAPAFADLNGDARLDVLLPGKNNFAVGLSGMDGSVIWDSGEEDTKLTGVKINRRSLAAATVNDGRLIVVGNDGLWAGLRALEIVKSAAKSNPE